MCAVRRVSMFYGGGYYDDEGQPSAATKPAEDNFSKEGWCPLCGDPLDHILADCEMKAEEKGYSWEEMIQRLQDRKPAPSVILNDDAILIEGHPLEGLNPSVRAFYILVCRHPEGISVGKENLHERYLDEYKGIYYGLNRKRKPKSDKGITFELDRRAWRYRDDINKAIKKLEERTGLDLSRCCIYGDSNCWRVLAAPRI